MFEGARQKIKRADRHIADLEGILKAFAENDSCGMTIQTNADGSYSLLEFSPSNEIPGDAALIIGDAVHNLRSALDIGMNEFVRRAGGVPTRWTRFEFFQNRNHLVTALKKAVLKGCPNAVDFLADVIQPYITTDNSLRDLHNLDMDDKHTIVIPVVSLTSLKDSSIQIRDLTMPDGRPLNTLVPPGHIFKVPGKVDPSHNIRFGNGHALENQAVTPTLAHFSERVAGVIDKFARWINDKGA